MIFPSGRDWLFSVKTFVAAMIALYLGLLFELPRPYWAMASVYIVSNPYVGATFSRGVYRVGGTLLGAAAAVFFVPPLAETPLLLSFVISVWTGCLLFLALSDRTARNYVFMLAGYTLPLIAYPTVDNPYTVFDVAVSRSEEIILGITCATIVNGVVFPSNLAATLGARTNAWFREAGSYARETLGGRIFGKDLSAARQNLAAAVNGLELFLSQLTYDRVEPVILSRAQSLRSRMSLLLPIASALGDPLVALRKQGAISGEMDALLADLTAWLNKSGDAADAEADPEADALRARIDALEPAVITVPSGLADTDGDTAADAASAPDTALDPVSGAAASASAASASAASASDAASDANANADADADGDADASDAVPPEQRESTDPLDPLNLPNDSLTRPAQESAESLPENALPTRSAALERTEHIDRAIGSEPFDNPTWDRALLSSLLWRLRLLIDLWQDCRTLHGLIEQDATKAWVPRLRHWRLGGAKHHVDLPMMILSIIPAVTGSFLAALLWILTGWADGAGAVTLTAVACSFFASLDQPAPAVFGFFVYAAVSTVLSGVYLFLVLPNAQDFFMLVTIFAIPFICLGTLIPRPQYARAALLIAVLTATFVGIGGTYDADFTSFLNGNMSACAGLLFAYICTRVMRPFGAELAAARLMRAGWGDIVLAASPHAIKAQNNMASRMLDRMMQLLPRLSASDDDRHPSIDSFRDLRIGLNALDLQHVRQTLPGARRQPIDQVLDGVRAYFQQCIDRKIRLPAPPELARDIDAALAADPEGRGALHALVGMRLSLFPAPKKDIVAQEAARDEARDGRDKT
jgi:uncharacterized membrane protein YccC